MFPAFWLLGDDYAARPWPRCGEVDIMEAIGRYPGRVYGALHGSRASGEHVAVSGYAHTQVGVYHVYGIHWSPAAVSWFVDGHTYKTVTRPQFEATGGVWVFDRPFHLVVNLAVGGDWGGAPDATTTWPQRMSVDWIRYYA